MCTVQRIKDAIWENCQSQYDMESTDIDRVLQTLPFSQEPGPFSKSRKSAKRRCIGSTQEKYEKVTATILCTGLWLFSCPEIRKE